MYTDTVNTHLLLVRVRFVCAQKHAHQALKINQNVVFSARSLFLMISNNIQFLGGIGWSLISPTDSNKWKQDCARLLAKITFWHRYCRVLLKALWSCWWWGGMSLSDEMKRSPSENWLFFFFFFSYFPSISEPLSHLFVIAKKKNCQSCNSVSTLPGCSYHSAPLPPPSKCFNEDAAWWRHLFPLWASLFLWRSVTFCTIFFPSDDTCGRIREQDRGVGGPLWIHRLIYCFCSCWTW